MGWMDMTSDQVIAKLAEMNGVEWLLSNPANNREDIEGCVARANAIDVPSRDVLTKELTP